MSVTARHERPKALALVFYLFGFLFPAQREQQSPPSLRVRQWVRLIRIPPVQFQRFL